MFFKTFRLGYGRVLAPIDPSIATTLKHQRGGDGDRGQYICGIKKGACLCGVVRPTVSAKALSFRFDSGVSRIALAHLDLLQQVPPSGFMHSLLRSGLHTYNRHRTRGWKESRRKKSHTHVIHGRRWRERGGGRSKGVQGRATTSRKSKESSYK